MNKSKFGKTYVEMDGNLISISNLEKEDYESFLELNMKLTIVYYMLMEEKSAIQMIGKLKQQLDSYITDTNINFIDDNSLLCTDID